MKMKTIKNFLKLQLGDVISTKANVNKINLFYVLYFLKWQLNYNKLKKITHDWIAVVRKNNKWILKLTTYLGYKMVKETDKEYKAIIKKFNVKFKNFFFLSLKVK